MLLQGSIHRFNWRRPAVPCTGRLHRRLEVRDFEEYGFIYLVEGQVKRSPCRDRRELGTPPQGRLPHEQQLAEALMEDSTLSHDEKKFSPWASASSNGVHEREPDPRGMGRQDARPGSSSPIGRTASSSTTTRRMPHFQVTIQATCRRCCSTRTGHRRSEKARKAVDVVDNEVATPPDRRGGTERSA